MSRPPRTRSRRQRAEASRRRNRDRGITDADIGAMRQQIGVEAALGQERRYPAPTDDRGDRATWRVRCCNCAWASYRTGYRVQTQGEPCPRCGADVRALWPKGSNGVGYPLP